MVISLMTGRDVSRYTFDATLAESIGLKHSDGSSLTTSKVNVTLWLGKEYDSVIDASSRFFTTLTNTSTFNGRSSTTVQAICVGK